jgi:hypothetical protein
VAEDQPVSLPKYSRRSFGGRRSARFTAQLQQAILWWQKICLFHCPNKADDPLVAEVQPISLPKYSRR